MSSNLAFYNLYSITIKDPEFQGRDPQNLRIDPENSESSKKKRIDQEILRSQAEKLRIGPERLEIQSGKLRIGPERLGIQSGKLMIDLEKLRIQSKKFWIDPENSGFSQKHQD